MTHCANPTRIIQGLGQRPKKDWPKAKEALAKGQSPLQELEVSPHSWLYVLLCRYYTKLPSSDLLAYVYIIYNLQHKMVFWRRSLWGLLNANILLNILDAWINTTKYWMNDGSESSFVEYINTVLNESIYLRINFVPFVLYQRFFAQFWQFDPFCCMSAKLCWELKQIDRKHLKDYIKKDQAVQAMAWKSIWINRQLTENIPNRTFYPQLGIQITN